MTCGKVLYSNINYNLYYYIEENPPLFFLLMTKMTNDEINDKRKKRQIKNPKRISLIMNVLYI